MKRALSLLVFFLAAAGVLLAHDTWLVPAAFRVAPGEPVRVALNTSEDFPASEAAPTPDRIARFDVAVPVVHMASVNPVRDYRVEEKSLVAEVTPEADLTWVVAETHPRLIVLKPEQFNEYITEERLDSVVAARKDRGQWHAEGRERYSKVAKLALCAGDSDWQGYETSWDLPLEIVPLDNPCGVGVGQPFRVRVLFGGKPLPNVWVGAGTIGTHGHHYPLMERADSEGSVEFHFDRTGPWFVRVLHMVPDTEFDDADWQSWFSTFTFYVE